MQASESLWTNWYTFLSEFRNALTTNRKLFMRFLRICVYANENALWIVHRPHVRSVRPLNRSEPYLVSSTTLGFHNFSLSQNNFLAPHLPPPPVTKNTTGFISPLSWVQFLPLSSYFLPSESFFFYGFFLRNLWYTFWWALPFLVVKYLEILTRQGRTFLIKFFFKPVAFAGTTNSLASGSILLIGQTTAAGINIEWLYLSVVDCCLNQDFSASRAE